jgi:hypothetical protein
VRSLTGSERDQVVADLTETVQSLRNVAARLRPPTSPQQGSPASDAPRAAVQGEIELQASWSGGKVVVWAGGPGRPAESHDGVSARLEVVRRANDGRGRRQSLRRLARRSLVDPMAAARPHRRVLQRQFARRRCCQIRVH